MVTVPIEETGMGVTVDRDRVQSLTVRQYVIDPTKGCEIV